MLVSCATFNGPFAVCICAEALRIGLDLSWEMAEKMGRLKKAKDIAGKIE
jgi:hypothetical protein